MSAQDWLRFAVLAREVAGRSLPRYAHRLSRQRFTLAQLAAGVLLKEYRQLDWRGIEALLVLSPPLRGCLGLKRVPDYSTLWRFARRWLEAQRLGQMLGEVVRRLSLGKVLVAVDATGLDPGRSSSYFKARRGGEAGLGGM